MATKTMLFITMLASALILQVAAQPSKPDTNFCSIALCNACTKCNSTTKTCESICPACYICGENGQCVPDPAGQCGRPKRTTPIELCLEVKCDDCMVCNQTNGKCEPRRCRLGERCNMLTGNCEQNAFNRCKTMQCIPCYYCNWDQQKCVKRECPFCQTCDKTVGECRPDPLLDCVPSESL